MFKLQSPSEYSPFDAIHLWRCFFCAQDSFWTCQFLCLLVLSPLPFFVSPLPHRQNISLSGPFSSGETKKKVIWGESGWIWRVGHQGHGVFGQKLLNLSAVWVGALMNPPSCHGQMEHGLSQQQLAHWHTWVPGHSPSGGDVYYKGPALRKIITVFFGPLWYDYILS